MKYLPILLIIGACVAPTGDDKGPESPLPTVIDGKADSFYTPTVHQLELGVPTGATIGGETRFHAFDFELSADAEVTLTTGGPDPYVDTVIYLFRWNGEKWGSYLFKSDDAPGLGWFSEISESLGAGEYRLMVKGYADYVEGPFELTSSCTGAGCAMSTGLPTEGEDCTRDIGCEGELRCEGFVAAIGLGKCVSLEPIPGEGNECGTANGPCAEGLVCAGSAFDPSWGLCNPEWMRGTFTDEANVALPDLTTTERTLYAYGLSTVSTDVEIDLELHHTYPGDLLITLTNAVGTEVTVFDGETDEVTSEDVHIQRALVGFPGDEDANGPWTLRITDRLERDSGTLHAWSLTVTSRWD